MAKKMNETPADPVAALLRAREKPVEQRRDLAASLGEEYQRGHTDARRAQFIEVQQAFEAIDRALEDERRRR